MILTNFQHQTKLIQRKFMIKMMILKRKALVYMTIIFINLMLHGLPSNAQYANAHLILLLIVTLMSVQS